MSTVFLCPPDQSDADCPASTDGRWQLAPSSPAIGAGIDGVDCGMYGGLDRYVLSGLPPIPAIYFINASTTATEAGLPIHLKVKSHN